MTVDDLRKALVGIPGNENVKVLTHTLRSCVGGSSCVRVTGASSGFDWDHGDFLIGLERPVVLVSEVESFIPPDRRLVLGTKQNKNPKSKKGQEINQTLGWAKVIKRQRLMR